MSTAARERLTAVVLCAGPPGRLEVELKASGRYPDLEKTPKALLPTRHGPALTAWWNLLNHCHAIKKTYIVVSAERYKAYERWATANGFPRENVLNDGTTSSTGGIGAVADFNLVTRVKRITGPVMVVAGDMLFTPGQFDLDGITEHYFSSDDASLAAYYHLKDGEDASKRGMLELGPRNRIVKRFFEKPAPGQTESRNASIVLYIFRAKMHDHCAEFLARNHEPVARSFGHFMEYLVNDAKAPLIAMKLPETFELIGNVGIDEYEACLSPSKVAPPSKPIVCRTCARIGLLGNPSDGFFGKTISLSIANFWAEASIIESPELELKRNPIGDPTNFGSLADLRMISKREGYQGGLRLMQATCKQFYEYCATNGISIARKNFTLAYDTNIPQQVGLAGSSAIVTSVTQCLMKFFNVTEKDIPKPEQAGFVLSVETEELGINAGLQDRVIQAYGGLVYMDFAKDIMDELGHGEYVELCPDLLPPLFLAYQADPSNSGKIHNDVRKRFDAGDPNVLAGMKKFGEITARGRAAIEKQDHAALADLMTENFELRRALYGDPALGAANIRMVEIANAHGAAAKFSGSGGAVVGCCRDPATFPALRNALEAEEFVVVQVVANR